MVIDAFSVVLIFCGLGFGVLGYFSKQKKWYEIFAGYTTMSEKEKSTIDIERQSKYAGIGFTILAASFIIIGVLAIVLHLSNTIMAILIAIPITVLVNVISTVGDGKAKPPAIMIAVLIAFNLIMVGSILFILFSTHSTL